MTTIQEKVASYFGHLGRLEVAEKAALVDDAIQLLRYDRDSRAAHEAALDGRETMTAPDDTDMLIVGENINWNDKPVTQAKPGMSTLAKLGLGLAIASGIGGAGLAAYSLLKPAVTQSPGDDTGFVYEAAGE